MIFRYMLAAFIIIPLIELYVLVKIGEVFGAGPTILLVLVTGIAGAYLAKAQGLMILSQIRNQLKSGQLPGDRLLDGLIILIGAAFLLTPGLLTDVTGFCFLIPLTRNILKKFLKQKFSHWMQTGQIQVIDNVDFTIND